MMPYSQTSAKPGAALQTPPSLINWLTFSSFSSPAFPKPPRPKVERQLFQSQKRLNRTGFGHYKSLPLLTHPLCTVGWLIKNQAIFLENAKHYFNALSSTYLTLAISFSTRGLQSFGKWESIEETHILCSLFILFISPL